MFSKKDNKIPDNNIAGVIKEETEEFDTSSNHGLSEIKYEFDAEETIIQYGVLENQLTEKKIEDIHFFGGEFSQSTQKIESTKNVMISKKAIKIEDDEIKSENTRKNDEINACLDSSNIKCEFEAEETTIQYGVLGNQLKEENFDEPQLFNGEFSENPSKMESTINDMFYQKVMQVEDDEIESESTSSNSSNIKCEFEEAETKIQYGVLENQLTEKNVDLQFFDGELSKRTQKIESTINAMLSKKAIKIADDEIKSENTEKNYEINTCLDSTNATNSTKCEFETEETTIQYCILGNQLKEEKFENPPKMETTTNDMFYQKVMQVEDDEIESESTSSDSSNIKCEFEADETIIQYGAFHNQLHEETFDKSTMNIPKVAMLDGKLTKSFQKTELPISNMCSKEDIELARSQKTDSTIFSNKKSHVCEFCDQCFNTMETLNVHRTICRVGHCWVRLGKISVTKIDQHNTRTKENVYKCETCNQCFRRTVCLSAHMKIHTGEKRYKCETCGKCFGEKTDLNRHNRTHTGKKPHKCKTCGKCFAEKANLNLHNRTRTGGKPHKCETCGKCFTVKGDLNRHNRTHTGEKPYKCETCCICFARKEALNVHSTTHTGENPYKCKTCGKCFGQPGTLIRHSRTHTGEKPYKWKTCGKCFGQLENLNVHNRTHTGEKPYKCETCGKCYTQKGN